ncbi:MULTISPECIES: NUDIX hydrolase [unclassified Streptomyces]|uniref:NUDIX hydrolase n=1 Tax=unclassified Streptomyces TaxID=2593676 RepID=UPI0012FF1FC5|nr:NUDIX domain-containing protein [Streptomyces sp. Root264]
MNQYFSGAERDAVIADWLAKIRGLINELNVFDRGNPYSASRANRLAQVAQEMSSVLKGERQLRNDTLGVSVLQHLSPLASVDCLVLYDKQVLLVRKEMTGGWVMPGGLIEMGETLADAGRRETKEEAGVEVEIHGIVGIFDSNLLPTGEGVHILDITLAATFVAGKPRPSGETSDARWWDLHELPALEHPHQQRLKTALQNWDNPLTPRWIGA